MNLLILGASARAAAFSALQVRLSPWAIDRFADRDLAAFAHCRRVASEDYPAGLVREAEKAAPGPWMYTGALENHPDLVDHLATLRPLWGNSAETLRAVRDPIRLASEFRKAGIACPEVRLDPEGIPRDGSWLRKPRASAGGYRIVRWNPMASRTERPCYYQRFVDGMSLSAVFVGTRTSARFVALTKQLVGRPSAPFAYRGSLAPWPVSRVVAAQVAAVGDALVLRFGLVGLFGVDLILKDETPWPVEVNPRYTASVEVVERALNETLMRDHWDACEGRPLTLRDRYEGARRRVVAKEILFAEAACQFVDFEADPVLRFDPSRNPKIADVPYPGTHFAPGEPVLTMFAEGATPEETVRALEVARKKWSRWLRIEEPRNGRVSDLV